MQFGYTIDIASVVGPYILYLMGVTNENISFYMSLGMVISNIICDRMASKHEEKMELKDDEDKKQILKAVEHLLENSQETTSMDDGMLQTTKSLMEIRKIIYIYRL